MKTPILLILALLGQVALAQQAPFDGTWDCGFRHPDAPLRFCIAICPGYTSDWTVLPDAEPNCPGSEHGSPGDTQARCEALVAGMPPLCCPPGTNCTRDTPGPEGPASSTSSTSRNKNSGHALIAGGLALFTAVLVKTAMQDELPDGVQIRPIANIAYRDGWSGAFAGLTATYGDWTMNASSRHSGEGWSGPDARLDWRALDYAGWVVNASGSYSGGQWAKPYAKVEWSWRF